MLSLFLPLSLLQLAVASPLPYLSSWATADLNIPQPDSNCQSGYSVALPKTYNFSAELPAFPLELPATISLQDVYKQQGQYNVQPQSALYNAQYSAPQQDAAPQQAEPESQDPKEVDEDINSYYKQLYEQYTNNGQQYTGFGQYQYENSPYAPSQAAYGLPQPAPAAYNYPYYGQQQPDQQQDQFAQFSQYYSQQAYAYPQQQQQQYNPYASPYAGYTGFYNDGGAAQEQAAAAAASEDPAVEVDNKRSSGRRLRDDPLLEDDDIEEMVVEKMAETEEGLEVLKEVAAEVAEKIAEEVEAAAIVEEKEKAPAPQSADVLPNYFNVENTAWTDFFPGATPEGRLCVPAAEAKIISRSAGEHYVSQSPEYGYAAVQQPYQGWWQPAQQQAPAQPTAAADQESS